MPSSREKHAKYLRERYSADPAYRAAHKARVKETKRKYYIRVDEILLAFRKDGCRLCPEKEHCCLSAHHLGDKDFNISYAAGRGISIKRILAELTKCICLCENCHRKVHAGLLVAPI